VRVHVYVSSLSLHAQPQSPTHLLLLALNDMRCAANAPIRTLVIACSHNITVYTLHTASSVPPTFIPSLLPPFLPSFFLFFLSRLAHSHSYILSSLFSLLALRLLLVALSVDDITLYPLLLSLSITSHCPYSTVTVFPPDSLGFQNKNAIYAVHLDASSCVCPDNYFLVYLTTEIQIPVTDIEHLSGALTDVELFWDQFVDANKHGANEELDRAASYIIKAFGDIAPPPRTPPSSSSSAPHPESDPHATQDADTFPLPPLASDLLPSDPMPYIPQPLPLPLPLDPNSTASSSSSSFSSASSSSLSHSNQAAAAAENVPRVTMLLSATTIRPLCHSAALSDKTEEIRSSNQANIALCGETTSSLTMVEEIAQAESLFHTLFPDSIFLPPKTTEMEEEEERERGETDIREEV
jgi:hypothetical protein